MINCSGMAAELQLKKWTAGYTHASELNTSRKLEIVLFINF